MLNLFDFGPSFSILGFLTETAESKMIASKAITSEPSGTSHGDPSESPEEGTKGRAPQELPGTG